MLKINVAIPKMNNHKCKWYNTRRVVNKHNIESRSSSECKIMRAAASFPREVSIQTKTRQQISVISTLDGGEPGCTCCWRW